jgi:hypothetical protein
MEEMIDELLKLKLTSAPMQNVPFWNGNTIPYSQMKSSIQELQKIIDDLNQKTP